MEKALSVLNAEGYRSYIKDWLASQTQSHGLRSEMCAAMGCQNAHLTRTIREEVHLTMDQAFRLTNYFKLNKAESSFFLKLVEHDRAGDPLYRKQLKEEMAQIKKEQENLAKRFQQDRIDNLEKEMTYYSSWHWIAVHYMTEIERYQDPETMAARLGLSEQFVRRTLEVLEGFQLVKRVGDKWQLNSGSIHLPKTSPLNSIQHNNWRQRAVLKSQNTEDDGVHFTVVQTLSHDDFEKIKQMILKTIDEYRKIARPSAPEELICFECDFFRV
jgi:uncharacterized protein (TIGR02147 family)